MEYISAEEFLKQPEEVQKVFIDWWKCDNGDLYVNNYELKTEGNYCNVRCCNVDLESNLEGEWEWFKGESTPILTEGQVRKFIEDKTNCKISVIPSLEGKYHIGYDAYADNEDGDLCRLVYVDKVLEGLWEVALKVAKED